MTENKCYDCVHRGEVPGSAHSSCQHPATHGTRQSPFMQLAGIVGKRGGDQLAAMASSFDEGPGRAALQLKIRGNDYGIRNGWFVWPVNFDPTWLESCEGFTLKESATSVDAVDPQVGGSSE